ncbi:DUF3558 family protein [Allokutzneria multivorans]|uniref:DUF3558 family protein n=1 Tax=Allokutzneria multivorans TaxID=1142134 RepID=A0ABP7QTU1_9PSEU
MRAAAVFVVAAALLSGCATTVNGTPSPDEVPTLTSPAPTGGGGSTALDPCTLLKMSDLTSYGTFKGPTREDIGGSRGCNYTQTGVYASDPSFAISVGIRDSQSAESVNDKGRGKISGNVNGRKAFKVPQSSQDCIFVLALGDSARVDVVIAGQEVERSCTLAEKFADVVEPRLPK